MDIQLEDFDSEYEFQALMADLYSEDYSTDSDGWERF